MSRSERKTERKRKSPNILKNFPNSKKKEIMKNINTSMPHYNEIVMNQTLLTNYSLDYFKNQKEKISP